MKANVGSTDAVVRWIVAIAAFTLSIIFNASPLPSLGFALVGLVMAATALTRSCPIYRLLGLSTCPRQPAGHRG